MAKLYRCVVCGKAIKRYNNNFGKYFVHCATKQEITDDNWINKPISKSVIDQKETEGNALKSDAKPPAPTQNPSEVSNSEPEEPQAILEEEEETVAREESQGGSMSQDKDFKSEDVQEIENPEEIYKYHCLGCNAYFDDLDNEACPSCKKTDVDVEVLNE